MRRIPHTNEEVDAYELPIVFGASVPLKLQWTLTVLTHPLTGRVTSAHVYNGDTHRGTFVESRPGQWHLTWFDYPRGSELPSPSITEYAATKLSTILGQNQSVSYVNASAPSCICDC